MKNWNMILKRSNKTSALLSGKIDKCESFTNKNILPPDQRRVVEQAKFAYSPLGKAFKKQSKKKD